jgi:hypothetical protein
MPLVQRMFSLTKPQEEWLKARAAQVGISPAELMRRIMDAARGEIGELLTASSRAPSLLAPSPAPAVSAPPSERAAAILELMRYCQEHHIPETRITELLTRVGALDDWRQASAADYQAVLDVLVYGEQST